MISFVASSMIILEIKFESSYSKGCANGVPEGLFNFTPYNVITLTGISFSKFLSPSLVYSSFSTFIDFILSLFDSIKSANS